MKAMSDVVCTSPLYLNRFVQLLRLSNCSTYTPPLKKWHRRLSSVTRNDLPASYQHCLRRYPPPPRLPYPLPEFAASKPKFASSVRQFYPPGPIAAVQALLSEHRGGRGEHHAHQGEHRAAVKFGTRSPFAS